MDAMKQLAVGPTLQLAQWVASLSYRDLPESTRRAVRISLLDTVGAAIYSARTPWAKAVLSWAKRGAPAVGEARVWGDVEVSLRVADAALVNGTAAHSFELDDFHNAKIHAGAPVIPAAIAVAEKLGLDGEALIASIAAGYEVMIRSSLAMNPSAARMRGWHLTGVCGTFGAAAACAVLMKLNAERTAWALGLAGTQSSGLWAFNADAAMSKRLHPGKASHSGVLAAELAELGFTGPTQIYEYADGGVLNAFSDEPDATLLTQDLGTVFHLERTTIKAYSCCGSTHSYVDAALELRSKLDVPWNMDGRVRVGTSKVVDLQCGFDYVPSTSLNAQMSLRYVIAVALIDGQVLPAQFTDAKIKDPTVTALAGRIELEGDPELDRLYPQNFAGWVAVECNGEWHRSFVMNPTGSVDKAIDEAGVVDKFRGINPELATDRIADIALAIERHSVRELLESMSLRK